MKVEGDKIVIEERDEIELLQSCFERYIKLAEISKSDKDKLEKAKEELDALWYSW